MKIIHQNGYSKEELLNFRMIVHKNLVDSAQALVMACRKLGVDPEDPANRVCPVMLLSAQLLWSSSHRESNIALLLFKTAALYSRSSYKYSPLTTYV